MIKFSIPTPCHEDWNKMTANSQGAFCNSCQKNVIDFTKLSDEEVLQYLNNNLYKETCGRIEVKQLDRINLQIDENILYSNISNWKKYLAIILICFGAVIMGCNNKGERNYDTLGGMMISDIEMLNIKDSVVKLDPPEIKGKLETITTRVSTMGFLAPNVITGDISIVHSAVDSAQAPVDTTQKIIIEKMDSIPKKDSIKKISDTCVNNNFLSI